LLLSGRAFIYCGTPEQNGSRQDRFQGSAGMRVPGRFTGGGPIMQGTGLQIKPQGPGMADRAALLDFHWGRVKGAMNALLMSYHSEDRRDSEELEDIFDYFVQKVEFDSPLAGPE
jgi:hypothetical protein